MSLYVVGTGGGNMEESGAVMSPLIEVSSSVTTVCGESNEFGPVFLSGLALD